MKNWQKGSIYGLVFTIVLSLIYTIVLVTIDIVLESQGLPHMCFMFTEGIQCTFSEAIETRLKFMLLLIVTFGPVITFFGGAIGYITDKLRIY